MSAEASNEAVECVAQNLAWALRCAATGCRHRPAIWYAEDAAKRIDDLAIRSRAEELCRAAREAGGYGSDPDYFPERPADDGPPQRAAAKPTATPRPRSDTRHSDVADAAFDAAKLFASAEWRQSDGTLWPDSGWAMVRGCVITLAFEEWARAYGMTAPPVVAGFTELAGVLEQARAIFRRLPLAELSPEYFGHVHEVLVGFHVQGGAVVPSGGRRKMGAHFTPADLADRVVVRTIEPLLKCIGDQSPLVLKICDPAVGAGAFLLSVIRMLAPLVLERGEAASLDEAKRLVAVHVVHGVDKDRFAPLASKYALRLECRADRMPHTWLDHAIKHGDALVGLDQEQLTSFHWKRDQQPLLSIGGLYKREIDAAARAAIAHREQLAAQARYA